MCENVQEKSYLKIWNPGVKEGEKKLNQSSKEQRFCKNI